MRKNFGMSYPCILRYSMQDKVGMLLSNFYDILTHSNLSFNDLNQAGVWLTLDKIINAVKNNQINDEIKKMSKN